MRGSLAKTVGGAAAALLIATLTTPASADTYFTCEEDVGDSRVLQVRNEAARCLYTSTSNPLCRAAACVYRIDQYAGLEDVCKCSAGQTASDEPPVCEHGTPDLRVQEGRDVCFSEVLRPPKQPVQR